MVESNYPEVVTAVSEVIRQFDEQSAAYPDLPLFVNVKEYPLVQSTHLGKGRLDGVSTAVSLNDIFLGSDQSRIPAKTIPKRIEPARMAEESAKLIQFDLTKRNTSIPPQGLSLLKSFFFGIYGRRSRVMVTPIYHPESLVAKILTEEPLVPLWSRTRGDMIPSRLTTFPIIGKIKVSAFIDYMGRFDNTVPLNDFYIGDHLFRVNFNTTQVDITQGGIWDRNHRTFGTWSPFPVPGDWLYGTNLAGMLLGILDDQLTGDARHQFKSQQWDKKITLLCLSATMNAYALSYVFKHSVSSE